MLVRHLVRHPPRDPAGVAALTGWVMLIAILLAPATRVGYLLYPINLFVWAWMFGQAAVPAAGGTAAVDGGEAGATVDDRASATQFSSSGSWKSSTEYGVTAGRGGRRDHDADLPVEAVAAAALRQHLGAAPTAGARARRRSPATRVWEGALWKASTTCGGASVPVVKDTVRSN